MPVRDTDVVTPARRLAALLEPLIGQVYFSPECHEGYAALGFGPSPGFAGATALPDGPAYFTSRGSILGQAPGQLVAAAFAVFNPAAVVPSVAHGWSLTDATTIFATRDAGALAQLQRVLGDAPGRERAGALLARAVEPLRPEGRPLFAGLLAHDDPADPWGALWRAGDRLREFRGDSHTAAWISAGLDATEIGLLSELWWGLPMKTYVRTRAWSEEQLDEAVDRLRSRGLLDGDGFSAEGRTLRAEVEERTDAQMAPAMGALGDDLDELAGLLAPWGASMRDAGGYLAAGPDDLARRVS
jgi:hypothetical protein